MGDHRLFRYRSRVANPRIQVCVEVNNGHWPVNCIESPQDWQDDRVVSAETM